MEMYLLQLFQMLRFVRSKYITILFSFEGFDCKIKPVKEKERTRLQDTLIFVARSTQHLLMALCGRTLWYVQLRAASQLLSVVHTCRSPRALDLVPCGHILYDEYWQSVSYLYRMYSGVEPSRKLNCTHSWYPSNGVDPRKLNCTHSQYPSNLSK